MPLTFEQSLYNLINDYRLANGRAPCVPDQRLERATALHLEWLAAKSKKQIADKYPYFDHNTNAQWLLMSHPELDWNYLFATFPQGLPEQLSAFDVAGLCGYRGGFVADVGFFNKKSLSPEESLAAWQHSPNHNRGLLWFTFRFFGAGKKSIGGGQTAVWCVFAEPISA